MGGVEEGRQEGLVTATCLLSSVISLFSLFQNLSRRTRAGRAGDGRDAAGGRDSAPGAGALLKGGR